MATQRPEDPKAAVYRQALTFADGLYRLARYLTGKNGDAEDLVQETYARAIAGLGGFTPETNLKAWLYRILRNAFIDQSRRRRKSPVDIGLDPWEAVEEPAGEPVRDDRELDRIRG